MGPRSWSVATVPSPMWTTVACSSSMGTLYAHSCPMLCRASATGVPDHPCRDLCHERLASYPTDHAAGGDEPLGSEGGGVVLARLRGGIGPVPFDPRSVLPTIMKANHTTILSRGGWMAATTMRAKRNDPIVIPTWFIRSRKRDPFGGGNVRSPEGMSTGSLIERPKRAAKIITDRCSPERDELRDASS